MKRFLINLLISALILYALTWIFPGITISSFGTAIVAALVLGLINAIIKPIISFLALPLTVLTLGLFSLVINALMLLLASNLVSGFHIDSFLTALFASIVMSLINLLFLKDRK